MQLIGGNTRIFYLIRAYIFLRCVAVFVFRKSRFLLIISCLFLSFAFCLASNNVNERSYEITQVSAIPVSEKVVIIDAGHGGADGGAVSSNRNN